MHSKTNAFDFLAGYKYLKIACYDNFCGEAFVEEPHQYAHSEPNIQESKYRHKYHNATKQYGRHATPTSSNLASSPNKSLTAHRSPASPNERTSGLRKPKIKNISAVHIPMPGNFTKISLTSSSGALSSFSKLS
jgi:hypothetical protein